MPPRLPAMSAGRRGGFGALAQGLDLRFEGGEVFLDDAPVGDAIRTEEAGRAASKIAALPALRAALLERQRAFRQAPGLVTDGRDMGSVVFPDATVKIFLTASAEERAQRRYKQLIEKGFDANLAALLQDLRSAMRAMPPVSRRAPEARRMPHLLDTTGVSIQAAVDRAPGLVSKFLIFWLPKALRHSLFLTF
jgi:cytidylate kinase